jgi:hypothetical protein
MVPSSVEVDVNEMVSPDSGLPGSTVNEAAGPSDTAAEARRPATPTAITSTTDASKIRRTVSRPKTPTIKAALLGTGNPPIHRR